MLHRKFVIIPISLLFLIISYIAFDLNFFRKSFFEPLFHIALSLLIVSPFLFFLRDEMFSKWIRLSVFWFGISTILIMIAPVYWGGWMSFGPTKELVSLWSGILFLLVNIFFIFHYRKGSR